MGRSAIRRVTLYDLRHEIDVALDDLLRFDYECDSTRSHAMGFLLDHARDVALGAALAAENDLFDSLATLARCLFEAVIWSLYVTQSEENAITYQSFGRYTLQKIIKAAEGGYSTGTFDVAEAKQALDQNGPVVQPNISQTADGLGIGPWFRHFYAYLSAPAHGHHAAWRTNPGEVDESDFVGVLGLASNCFTAIHDIYRTWVWGGKQVEITTIQHLIYVENPRRTPTLSQAADHTRHI